MLSQEPNPRGYSGSRSCDCSEFLLDISTFEESHCGLFFKKKSSKEAVKEAGAAGAAYHGFSVNYAAMGGPSEAFGIGTRAELKAVGVRPPGRKHASGILSCESQAGGPMAKHGPITVHVTVMLLCYSFSDSVDMSVCLKNLQIRDPPTSMTVFHTSKSFLRISISSRPSPGGGSTPRGPALGAAAHSSLICQTAVEVEYFLASKNQTII